MAANYPFLPQDSVDSSQFTDQSSPDTGTLFPDFSGGVPLSGDTYVPAQQGADTSLPFVPTQTLRPNEDKFPGFYKAPAQQQALRPNEDKFPGFYGAAKATLPTAAPAAQVGPPKPNYGNDLAGSVLQAETNLPGGEGTQAFVHGAQSQVGPAATALAMGAGGAALGTAVLPGIGTVLGGLAGGLIGYWIGSQAQDTAGHALVPQQTMDALKAQTDYEQKNYAIQYGLGELFPQALAFKPNPKNVIGAFKLVGKVTAAPMSAKYALLKDPAESQNLGTLLIMAYGTGNTAIQAKQQIDSGDLQPGILAINLLGTALLNDPYKWVGRITPQFRKPILDSHATAANAEADGIAEVSGLDPENKPLYDALQTSRRRINDLQQAGKSAEASQESENYLRLSKQLEQAQAYKPTNPVAQELIDMVNNGEITSQEADQRAAQQGISDWKPLTETPQTAPAEQTVVPPETDPRSVDLIGQYESGEITAAEADKIAAQQGLPNWESLVQKEQQRVGSQARVIQNKAEQFANSPYERAPVVTGPEHQAGLQAAVDKFGLQQTGPRQVGPAATPDELRASIAGNQAKTEAMQKDAFNWQRRQSPGEPLGGPIDEQIARSQDRRGSLVAEDSINVPEIKNLLSEARTESGVGAGIDPSFFVKTGKNMYSGDLGKITVKEALQNAVDSLRGLTGNGAGRIDITLRPDGVKVTDNGRGMTPEVISKELVDVGASGAEKKGTETSASGGWGLAKIALFVNAQEINVRSIAKLPKGGTVETELTGSGQDWIEGKLQMVSYVHPPGSLGGDQYTGTTMNLTFNEDVRYDPSYAWQQIDETIKYLNTSDPLQITLGGGYRPLNSADQNLVRNKFDHVTTLNTEGAKIDVYTNPIYEKSEWGGLDVKVLNNGIYQFGYGIPVPKGVEMPRDIVVDIHAKGSPEQDNYPWETNRQSIRPDLSKELDEYFEKNLVKDAAKKQAVQIARALSAAPRLAGSNFRVVDLSGRLNPEMVSNIAKSEPLLNFVKQASRAFGSFKGGTDAGPEFFGISLSSEHLGVNIHASAGGPNRVRNMVLINPFLTLTEVSRLGNFRLISDPAQVASDLDLMSVGEGKWADRYDYEKRSNWEPVNDDPYVIERYVGPTTNPPETDWPGLTKLFASRTAATLIHEYSHESARSHDEPFTMAMTRDIAVHLENIYSYAKRMTRFLSENNYEGIKEIERLNREHDLTRRMGSNEIFRNVSTGSAAEGLEPGGNQSDITSGTERGQRPADALRPGSSGEAEQLAPSTDLERSRPEQTIGEQNGIQQTPTSNGQEAGQIGGETAVPASLETSGNATNAAPANDIFAGSGRGNGTPEPGSVRPSSIGAGAIRPDAGNVTEPISANAVPNEATNAASANATANAAGPASNAEATISAPGNGTTVERGSPNAQPATEAGATGRATSAVVQRKLYGDTKFSETTPDHQVMSVGSAMLDHMTPRYMVGLVREGLGKELQALIIRAGGMKKTPVDNKTMPLDEAISTLLEHQKNQWDAVNGGKEKYVNPEVETRSIYEPEITEANAKELGKIYQEAIANQAQAEPAGGGTSPTTDTGIPGSEGAATDTTGTSATTDAGTIGGPNAATTDQNVISNQRLTNMKTTADLLRVQMKVPGYEPKPEERELLNIINRQVSNLQKYIANPNATQTWPVADKRLSDTAISNLRARTEQAVASVPRLPEEGQDGYAQKVVKASSAYQNLDHAVAVLKASRDGYWEPVKTADGNVAMKIDGKLYKGTPNDQVKNWDKGFRGVIQESLDRVPLAGEPPSVSPLNLDPAQLRVAFKGEFDAPVAAPSTPSIPAEETVIPSMKSSDFRLRSGTIPTSKLTASNAANQVEGKLEGVQQSLDLRDLLTGKGIFDPEGPVVKKYEELSKAAGGGSGLPPPPTKGGAGGEEPPSGGRPSAAQTEAEKLAEAQKQELAEALRVQKEYVTALKDSLTIDNPLHQKISAGINDLVTETAATFDPNEYQKRPETWAKEAGDKWRALGVYFDRVGKDLRSYIDGLETLSPGANDRIRSVIHATDPEARQAALKGLSAQEAAIANHIYNYWQVMGNMLKRSGVIQTALENYFPHMIEKTSQGKTPLGGTPGERGPRESRFIVDINQAIERLTDRDGHLLYETPEELQAYFDSNPKTAGWKVKTGVADVFTAQGQAVTRALTMKHTVDQLSKNLEFQIGKNSGELARTLADEEYFHNNAIAGENRKEYREVRFGAWKNIVKEYKVWRPLADFMEREASVFEMPENKILDAGKSIYRMNSWFKQYKFISPIHIYSLLGNMSTHSGWTGMPDTLRRGSRIVDGPDSRRLYQLMKAGGPDEMNIIPEAMNGPAGVLQRLGTHGWDGALTPAGKFFQLQHDVTWKKVGYNGTFGLADKLSEQYLADWAAKHPGELITPQHQLDADKFAMDAAKKALGYIQTLDMSKDWDLWGSVMLLANRWTTAQMRTMGEAFGIKPLARLGSPAVLEGSSPAATKFMQERAINASRRLVWGGLFRLLLTGTAMSTAISWIHNGTPSTPWDNYQKDPNHVFDIYTGRDANNRDTWTRMPLYLFQREMVDWAMAGVKAQVEGKDFFDVNNIGDSVLAAPIERFASKSDPITKLSLELATGQEMGQWMHGYTSRNDKNGIDADPYIQNINKSLQMMGIPDGGSLENRLIYAMRALMPSAGFPANPQQAAPDPGAVASALGFGTFNVLSGNNLDTAGLWAAGSRPEQGTAFTVGPDGTMVPKWEVANEAARKADIGQQILAVASTLGTGATAAEETQKLEQMEGLRQQGGFTPGQLVQILLYGAGHSSGEKGLLYQNLPAKTPEQMQVNPSVVGGKELSPQEEVSYQSNKFQHEAFAIAQLMGDPVWKSMQLGDRSAAANSAKNFADRITDEQFKTALGLTKANPVTTPQVNSMIIDFGRLQKQTQADLRTTTGFTAANINDQKAMLADRVSSTETAVWDKYFGVGILKNATDSQMLNYVDLHSSLRDEVRQLVTKLPSYNQANDPAAQVQMLNLGLKFADNLVNTAAQGKTMKTFDSPLNRQQMTTTIRNGIVLQDAALRELHNSFIYQEASTVDQGLLDQKYSNLAHNVALYDMRVGATSQGGSTQGFDASLRTTLAADEGYQSLVEQYFGIGGLTVLNQKEAELNDLKTRFKQENAIAPAHLAAYDTMINRWYDQQNPDYAEFKKARTWWEAHDPVGQAYRAASQSNLGFESLDPLALSTS